MAAQAQSFAVVGSTPFALVLAGLLAADHSRPVVLIAPRPLAYPVPPPPSLAIAPSVRPETLHIALRDGPEMMRRLARIAPLALDRIDLIVQAHTQYHGAALSHFRHLAVGFGQQIEREIVPGFEADFAVRIRDVARFSAVPFLALAQDWTQRIGVEWVSDSTDIHPRRNGGVQIVERQFDQLVIADDDAAFSLIGAEELAGLGRSVDWVAGLAGRGHRQSELCCDFPNQVLINPNRDGFLEFFAANADKGADARLAMALPPNADIRKAAIRPFRALAPHDGAPLIGHMRHNRAYLAIGLGRLDIALAPTIARHLCGQAEGTDAEWCALRSPSRSMAGSLVAEPTA